MKTSRHHLGHAGGAECVRLALLCAVLGASIVLAGCSEDFREPEQEYHGNESAIHSRDTLDTRGAQSNKHQRSRTTVQARESLNSGNTQSTQGAQSTASTTNIPAFPAPIPLPIPHPFPGKGKMPFPVGPPEPPPEPPVTEPTFPLGGGAFKYPLRIAYTDTGWLLVTDTRRNQVLRVDPETLQADQAFRVNGMPLAIGILGGDIFVSNRHKASVEVYDLTGKPKGHLEAPGTSGYPTDLAVDSAEGLVLVLDSAGRQVRVYRAAERALVGVIGQSDLKAPTGIAVDPSRSEVLVSDYGADLDDASVQIFSYAPGSFGALAATISGAGQCNFFGCKNGFSRPRGPAVYNSRVYVPDVMLAQVLVFDRDSLERVSALGSGDRAINDLRVPTDAVIAGAGDLYVTSPGTKAVVRFAGGAP